jgi:hypothetical protein
MNKIIKFLDELNDEELFELEKDIKSVTIQKFIEQKNHQAFTQWFCNFNYNLIFKFAHLQIFKLL